MIVFDNVVEVLDLAYGDRRRHTVVDLIDSRLVRIAFIHRDRFGCTALTNGIV